MIKKEMIAMLLAGGQGSRLGVLTSKLAKPAVAFGGKYKIIDFPLSNCINSGVDTVGVLTTPAQSAHRYRYPMGSGSKYWWCDRTSSIREECKQPVVYRYCERNLSES